jgi:hypothetical protein
MILKKKIEAIQAAIKMQEYVMREAQAEIRKANTVIDDMQREYRRAMEEKINLQDRLVTALIQQHEEAEKVK